MTELYWRALFTGSDAPVAALWLLLNVALFLPK